MLTFLRDHKFYKPFDEITCPLCDCSTFTTIYNSSVWCDHCNSRFSAYPAGSDGGYCVDCFTDLTWKERVKYSELIGANISCSRKEGEPPKWLIYSEAIDWPYSRALFIEKHRELAKQK